MVVYGNLTFHVQSFTTLIFTSSTWETFSNKMSMTSSSLLTNNTFLSPLPFHHRITTKTRHQNEFFCFSQLSEGAPKEDIVIVGAGIAGLATALALHRVPEGPRFKSPLHSQLDLFYVRKGIQTLVVEQRESLRTGGTSLTLFKNGWKVLDMLGVGNELRTQFLEIQGMSIRTDEGNELRSFKFKDDQSQEVRAVERSVLLQALADQLPADSLQFSSKLAKIEKDEETGETILELVDGNRLSAKVVVGCDGIRSPIARWMGFSEPTYSGHCAFRGLAFYPEGQPYESMVNYIYGKGLRAGFVPVSPTKVYWFICYNSSSPGSKVTDRSILKRQALDMVKSWPSDLSNIINVTPDDTIIRSPLQDRWLWPGLTPSVSKGGVVLVGDAWHPMTPNLGQGGCCALEDAVVLAKKLSGAIKSRQGSIDDALKSYGDERWPRIFPLTIRSNLVGRLLQWENPIVCSIRNGIVVPKLVQIGPLLEHTNFSCEPL